jgi:hypothetical protein
MFFLKRLQRARQAGSGPGTCSLPIEQVDDLHQAVDVLPCSVLEAEVRPRGPGGAEALSSGRRCQAGLHV